ncbi:hypothetical protein HKX48_007296 [Thoreauomyces humboldtii]|nr:hypothetical protein HKX48_007296 [Thoreauomyces humboldtii]
MNLLARGASPSWKDENERTALVCAIYGEATDSFPITQSNYLKATHCRSSHAPIVRTLLRHILATTDATARTRFEETVDHPQSGPWLRGITPLCLAAYLAKPELVRVMVEEGADVDARDLNGATALMYASRDARISVAKVLLEFGARVDLEDNNGWTAMRYGHAYPDAVGMLEAHAHAARKVGKDVFPPSMRLTGALTARYPGLAGSLSLLIRRRIRIENVEGGRAHGAGRGRAGTSGSSTTTRSALFSAIKRLDLRGLHAALQTLPLSELNVADPTSGLTPLQSALRLRPVTYPETEAIVRILVALGAGVNSRNLRSGKTPLHYAVRDPYLIPDATSQSRESAIPITVRDIARFLLSSGADVNAPDLDRNLPLHHACRGHDVDLVRVLLKSGRARASVFNKKGKRPLDLCTNRETERVVKEYLRTPSLHVGWQDRRGADDIARGESSEMWDGASQETPFFARAGGKRRTPDEDDENAIPPSDSAYVSQEGLKELAEGQKDAQKPLKDMDGTSHVACEPAGSPPEDVNDVSFAEVTVDMTSKTDIWQEKYELSQLDCASWRLRCEEAEGDRSRWKVKYEQEWLQKHQALQTVQRLEDKVAMQVETIWKLERITARSSVLPDVSRTEPLLLDVLKGTEKSVLRDLETNRRALTDIQRKQKQAHEDDAPDDRSAEILLEAEEKRVIAELKQLKTAYEKIHIQRLEAESNRMSIDLRGMTLPVASVETSGGPASPPVTPLSAFFEHIKSMAFPPSEDESVSGDEGLRMDSDSMSKLLNAAKERIHDLKARISELEAKDDRQSQTVEALTDRLSTMTQNLQDVVSNRSVDATKLRLLSTKLLGSTSSDRAASQPTAPGVLAKLQSLATKIGCTHDEELMNVEGLRSLCCELPTRPGHDNDDDLDIVNRDCEKATEMLSGAIEWCQIYVNEILETIAGQEDQDTLLVQPVQSDPIEPELPSPQLPRETGDEVLRRLPTRRDSMAQEHDGFRRRHRSHDGATDTPTVNTENLTSREHMSAPVMSSGGKAGFIALEDGKSNPLNFDTDVGSPTKRADAGCPDTPTHLPFPSLRIPSSPMSLSSSQSQLDITTVPSPSPSPSSKLTIPPPPIPAPTASPSLSPRTSDPRSTHLLQTTPQLEHLMSSVQRAKHALTDTLARSSSEIEDSRRREYSALVRNLIDAMRSDDDPRPDTETQVNTMPTDTDIDMDSTVATATATARTPVDPIGSESVSDLIRKKEVYPRTSTRRSGSARPSKRMSNGGTLLASVKEEDVGGGDEHPDGEMRRSDVVRAAEGVTTRSVKPKGFFGRFKKTNR